MISVRNLSKSYRRETSASSLREAFEQIPTRLFQPRKDGSKERFWALRDVSFEISAGQAVGFIGRNGAGKSTLLKILSRIADPTSGEVDIYGKTGSLLGIGTGFHSDLSGRENVLLNGVMLGMSRQEVRRNYAEIVSFSGIEEFIDTPVKYYSSGMYVRLAFAVAAHFVPEVLILDEVLAAGDADFQKKCFAKMDEVRRRGSTVVLVSHDLNTIERFCDRAFLLENGQLVSIGDPTTVVGAYRHLIGASLPVTA